MIQEPLAAPCNSLDRWQENRVRQLTYWAAQPVERRVQWLKEAVAVAFTSGALPRRLNDVGPPVQPLSGTPEEVAAGESVRRDVLERAQAFCRGTRPDNIEPGDFAEYGALLQFALWRVEDAAFWTSAVGSTLESISARVAERDRALGQYVALHPEIGTGIKDVG